MHHEGKWGSFLTIVFREGAEGELGSRNERPMSRHFPGLVESLKGNLPKRYAGNGEIIIVKGDRLGFEALRVQCDVDQAHERSGGRRA
jgi:ATP-dependent DNA ligase